MAWLAPSGFQRRWGFARTRIPCASRAICARLAFLFGSPTLQALLSTPIKIVEAMHQDKKVEQGALTFILARGIGDCFVAKNIDAGKIRSFLQDELNTGY